VRPLRSFMWTWTRWCERWFAPSSQSTSRVGRVSKSCVLAAKIASLFVDSKALPVWALSMLVGLGIVDSLLDNVAWNVGFGIVHIGVLKAYTRWGSEYSIFR
jgi:hypothetical protein